MALLSWIPFTLLNLFTKLGFHLTCPFYVAYFRKLDLIDQLDVKAIFQYRLIQLLFLGKGFHYLFLWPYQNRLSHHLNILHFNLIYLEHQPSYFNVCLCLAGILSALNMHVLYYQNRGISTQILGQLLIEKRQSFFLQANYFSNHQKSHYLSRSTICEKIEYFALTMENGLDLLLSPPIRKNANWQCFDKLLIFNLSFFKI